MTPAFRAAVVVTLCAALGGCHRKTDDITRNQQQYDVVTESSGGTVSSTVGAPGEPPKAQEVTMTATSVDTTTSFTVAGTSVGSTASTATDGSLAGTLSTIGAASTSTSQRPPGSSSRASTRTRRPPVRPAGGERTDLATTTLSPEQAKATAPSTSQEQTTRPQPPPEPPSRPSPDTDTSKPPATDTTSTSPPQR